MAIDFDQLSALLTPDGGRIDVAGSAFETPSVETLFQRFLPAGRLVLVDAEAKPDPERRRVAVKGKLEAGALLELQDARVPTATFELLVDGSVTALLDVSVGDAGWKLSSSFPVLAESVLDQVTYADAVFTLDSAARDVLPANFRRSFGYEPDVPLVAAELTRGLSFRASLRFTGGIARDFTFLFREPISVAGPVEVYFEEERAFPQLLLRTTSDSGRTERVGEYELKFGLDVACLLQELMNSTESSVAIVPAPVLAVGTAFVPGARQQLEPAPESIPIRAYMYDASAGTVSFNVGEPPVKQLDKAALPGFLNGTSLGSLLDPGSGFPAIGPLRLETLSLELALNPLSLQGIWVGVRLADDEPWSLFDGFLTIDGIALLVGVSNDEGKFVPSAAAYARAALAENVGISLEAFVSLPDLAFACTLTQSKRLDLTRIVKERLGVDLPLPDITGGTFEIEGNVKQGTYSFDAQVEQTWTFVGTEQKGLTLGNLRLAVAKDPKGVTAGIYATLRLAGVDLVVSALWASGGGWTFSGETAAGVVVDLTRLLRELAAVFDLELPEGLPEVDLEQVSLEYATQGGTLQVKAAVRVPGAALDLTALPLVGKHLDPGQVIALDRIEITVEREGGKTTGQVTLAVRLGPADTVHVAIPLTRKPQTEARLLPAVRQRPGVLAVYPAEGSGVWIPVQRSFGPVRVEKIGFTLEPGGLGVQFTASLALSGLTIRIIGLELIVPLRAPYVPGFDIHGLEVMYDTPALKIAGGLLRIENPEYMQFDGYLIVQAKAFSAVALASFATSEPPSMFAFVFVDVPIGGPPAFFVTGLGGGFGVNRSLELPPIDKVEKFPLVAAASKSTNPFGPDPKIPDFIQGMGDAVRVAIGQNWIAAGVRFTSFKILDSYALLTVAFGTRFQVGLLGLSTIKMPPLAPEPVAEAHLALRAVYDPGEGTVSVAALLTPDSYVLSKDCKLTGGFAFYLWFEPSKLAPDFVVTLGGYNPYYSPPKHYPDVPRLGFNWNVRGTPLVIKGGLYFALTPHAAMAGGSLSATWESGAIKAWFDVKADFLVEWKPFHYDARMGVNFGVRATVDLWLATVTISISVGADLHIWGPEFSGVAKIHLSVISFTIEFGAKAPKPPPILWGDFRDSFLAAANTAAPELEAGADADASVLRTMVSDGLLAEVPRGVVVDPQRFELVAQTLVPAGSVVMNGKELDPTWNRDFGIGPMAVPVGTVTSELRVQVTRETKPYDRLIPAVVAKKAPKALWLHDPKLADTLNAPAQLDDVAQGVRLVPLLRDPRHSLPIEIAALLYESAATIVAHWGFDVAPTTDPFGGLDPWSALTETIDASPAADARADIVASLIGVGFGVSHDVDVKPLTDRNRLGLLDPFQLSYLGEKKAVGA